MVTETTNIINKFNNLCNIDREPTKEEMDFIEFLPIYLAKSIIADFGYGQNDVGAKMAKIILSMTDNIERM